MYRKKSDQASLENKKGIFFQLGLLIAISMVLISFEWTRGSITLNEYNMEGSEFVDEIIIPTTFDPPPEPPKPPKPKVVEELKLVEDTYELKDELILDDFDIKEHEEISFIDYDDDPHEIEEQIHVVVQNMPSFQGKGQDGFRQWISQQLEYPEIAAENGISGTVYVSFVVEPDGRVTNVELVRAVDPALDAEAIRVIQLSPRWEPGMQWDVAVRVSFVFPIKFKLQH